MGMLKFLLLALMLIKVNSGTECPFSCQCYQQSGINSIFCVKTGLTDIPNYFNFEVKILNFTANHLPNLTDAFRNQHYKSVEILDLSRNEIANIDERSLRQLKNLLEIDLSDNRIRSVPTQLFDNNRFLNTIHLRGNPIDEIVDYAFSPSIYLRRVNFQGCRVRRIRKFAFVNTPLLEYLNLKDNDLKSFSLGVLHFTPELNTLLLDGNPWRCDKKLWSLLKWLRSKNMAVNSLLCVYGETDDAILWDTMDVHNALKFRDTEVPKNVKRIPWRRSHPKRSRFRRALFPETAPQATSHGSTKLRQNRHSLVANADRAPDFDYPSLDHLAEGVDLVREDVADDNDDAAEADDDKFQEGESNGYSSPDEYDDRDDVSGSLSRKNAVPHQATFRYNQIGDPKLILQYDASKIPKQPGLKHPMQEVRPISSAQHNGKPDTNVDYPARHSLSKQTISGNADHYLKYPPASFVNNAEDSAAGSDEENDEQFETINEFYYHTATIDSANDVKKKVRPSEESDAFNDTNADHTEGRVDDGVDAFDADGVNMNFMLVVIAVEFLLLTVLLFVLYKLWSSNKRSRETDALMPLNNNNKTVKMNDTQSPGYKRYSLSDDDYTDLRKATLVDETKCDSESGYLSYHRYNSNEGEANNEGMLYRRNQREDSNEGMSSFTNAELDSIIGNDGRPEENEPADRRMRRNSSMRSVGRRAKINVTRRSYSDDIRHEDGDV